MQIGKFYKHKNNKTVYFKLLKQEFIQDLNEYSLLVEWYNDSDISVGLDNVDIDWHNYNNFIEVIK